MAHTPWGKDAERTYPKCWYKPHDQGQAAWRALRFTLSLDITAALPPGDERLFKMALDMIPDFTPLTEAERQEIVASTAGVEPIFRYPATA